jgi:hypothetical protein
VEPLTFTLDERDHLIAANAEWDVFAAANGGPVFERVRGHPLASFINGSELTLIWHHLLARVREGARLSPLRIPTGSGSASPALVLRTSLDTNGTIAIHAVPDLRELPLPLSPLPKTEHGLLYLCSWCHRMRRGGEWIHLEDAVTALRLLERPTLPMISHGMCSFCYEATNTMLERRERKPRRLRTSRKGQAS